MPSHIESFLVSWIYNVDDGISVLVVATPIGPEASLATKIPYLQFEVVESDLLDIKTNSRHRWFHFAQVKSVEYCGFTSIVKTNNDDSHLVIAY